MRWFLTILLLSVTAGAALTDWRLGAFAYLFTGFCVWLIVPEIASLWRMCLAWAPALLWEKARDFACPRRRP